MLQALDGGTQPPLGPLSRAVVVDEWIFVAGTIGTFDDGTLPPTVEEQTAQTLENISSHLEAGGLSLDDLVNLTVYITRREHFRDMNAAYARYFAKPFPARATVVCDLVHDDHLVEISAVAKRGARA